MIRQALRHIHTGADNETHDLGRWSWTVSLLAVIAAGLGNWMHGAMIDLVQLASALGIVAGAHGAALFAKKDTEPKAAP